MVGAFDGDASLVPTERARHHAAHASRDNGLDSAGIAHAQTESIDPCFDGNGWVGARPDQRDPCRRGTTTRDRRPNPIAVCTYRGRYFDLLGSYRNGHIEPVVSAFGPLCVGPRGGGFKRRGEGRLPS